MVGTSSGLILWISGSATEMSPHRSSAYRNTLSSPDNVNDCERDTVVPLRQSVMVGCGADASRLLMSRMLQDFL